MSWKRLSRPLALSALAFTLQIWRLGEQSLWYDEGFSVWLASRPLIEILARTAADIHPPLYYVLLAGWMDLAGAGEFSLRYLSVLAAVATIPLMWALGRRTLGEHSGTIAALLVAISPLWLWYARDARMYTLVTALVVASTLSLLRWMDRPRRATLGVYVFLNALAIYTHFFAWFIVAAQAGFGLLWMLFDLERRRRLVSLVGAWGAIFLVYLPWLRFVFIRLGADRSYWGGTLSVGHVVETIIETWAVGHTVDPTLGEATSVIVLFLAAGGLGALLIRYSRQKRARRTLLLLVSWLVIPLIALLLVSFGRPKYHPRYMMIGAPAYVLALTALPAWLFDGKWQIRRIVGTTLGLGLLSALVAVNLFADYNLYTNPAFTKDDWRSVAQLLEREHDSDEPILLVSGHAYPVFTYYYEGDDWIPLPDEPTLDTTQVLSWDIAPKLAQVLDNAEGVWLVAWQDEVVDPDRLVPFLLNHAGGVEQSTPAFWGVEVRHWRFPERADVPLKPPMRAELNVNFDDQIRLVGWEPPEEALPANRGVPLTLYWELSEATERDLKVTLEIVDGKGFSWGQLDRRPGNYFHPTFRWRPNDVRPGRYDVSLAAGTPPGTYYVEAGVYADETGEELDVLDEAGAPQGHRARLGAIEVVSPTAPMPAPRWPKMAWWHDRMMQSGITLLATQVVAPESTLEPGFSVPVSLWWRATETPDEDVTLHFGWQQNRDTYGADSAIAPGGPNWPAQTWREGELVLTKTRVRVPPEMPAGPAALVAWLTDAGGEDSPSVRLGEFDIVESDKVFTEPAPQHEQVSVFDETVRLIGYDIPGETITPGRQFTTTLYWQALGSTEAPLTSFVHLLDADGRFVAGQDHEPQDSAGPTDAWVRGEYVRDDFAFEVPAVLPPGPYRLEVGWYDSSDPELPRLPAAGEGADGNRVILETEFQRAE